MFKQKAFTLVELMITLVVAAILTAAAVPAYRAIVQNNRAVTLSHAFATVFHYARSEAIKRGSPVTICSSANTAQTACGNATNWGNGWLVFVDPDGNGVLAASTDRLRVQEALPNGTSITTALARITFDGSGFVTGGTGTFTLAASGCAGNHGRSMAVSNTGRVSVTATSC